MVNDQVKYLIVGAGASGLTFANYCDSDDYLVIEKEDEAGGYCRTIKQDGYIWDYAGHFFHFVNPQIKQYFRSRVDESELVRRVKNTKIWFAEKFVDFPFQSNIHQLPKEYFIDCLYDLYFKEEKENYDSFLEMLYGKFGKSITDLFLKPYNEKLYACDLDKLDVNAMGRFFPHANIEQIIASFKQQAVKSYNAEFLYPKNGAQVFIKALLSDLDQAKVCLKEVILGIDIGKKVVRTNKRVIAYEFLINSAPLDKLIGMTENSPEIKAFKKDLSCLSYNKVLVFNLGFDKKSHLNELHWVYFPQDDINFYRVGFYDNILDSDRLSMYVEIGFSSNETPDIEAELEKVISGLISVGVISDHNLVSYCSIVMDPAYVHVSEKANAFKDEVKDYLSAHSVYTIGRYGDWKYCSIEDSMLDAVNLSKVI